MVSKTNIQLQTKGNTDIIDITDRIESAIHKSGISTGIMSISNPGSTTSITTIEFEPGLVNYDLREALEIFSPISKDYKHHQTWGDHNGSAHVRSAIMGPSLSLPIVDNKLVLGTWQQIVFIDFDERPRSRTLTLVAVGE